MSEPAPPSANRTGTGRLWTWRRAGAAAALLAAAPALWACSEIDARQSDICAAILPALEPAGSDITITAMNIDAKRQENLRVRYRVVHPATEDDPAETVDRFAICAFGGSGFEAGKTELAGVATPEGAFSDIKLHLLNRHWLADTATFAEALRQVHYAPGAKRQGFVDLKLDTAFFIQQIVNAGPPSALYGLLALAYSLVYGLVNRINVAFGDIAMLGAYAGLMGIVLSIMIGAPGPGIALPIGLIAAIAITAGWGGVIGRVIFKPLIGRASQPLLVASVGLSMALQEFVGRAQGVREQWLPPILNDPHQLTNGPFTVIVTTMQIVVVVAAAILVALTAWVMKRSRFGRTWRATADDALMARMVGINPDRVLILTFMLSSALAAVAGMVLTVHYGGTSFAMGTIIGLKALVAAIIGGIGSLPGAILGGVLIGLTETFWSAYMHIVWRDAVILVLMAVFLILKPEGLLGTRRALEEKEDRV